MSAEARRRAFLMDGGGHSGGSFRLSKQEEVERTPSEDEIRELEREQRELEDLRKSRRHKLSLDQAQEAAPDAVWTPRLKQDNAGAMARQELEQKARTRRAEEQARARAERQLEAAEAKRAAEEAKEARAREVENMEQRESRLRERLLTTCGGRALLFLICVAVGAAAIVLITASESYNSLTGGQMIMFLLCVIFAIVNFCLGLMWCTNKGWGRGRELLCCIPWVCDEADVDDYSEDDEDDMRKRAP